MSHRQATERLRHHVGYPDGQTAARVREARGPPTTWTRMAVSQPLAAGDLPTVGVVAATRTSPVAAPVPRTSPASLAVADRMAVRAQAGCRSRSVGFLETNPFAPGVFRQMLGTARPSVIPAGLSGVTGSSDGPEGLDGQGGQSIAERERSLPQMYDEAVHERAAKAVAEHS